MAGLRLLKKVFIGKCYRLGMVIGIGYGGSGTPGSDPPLLSHFSFPIFPNRPSYPQPEPETYPQFAVHNRGLLRLVSIFLCITPTQLNIMDVVGSEIGKTLGTDDF